MWQNFKDFLAEPFQDDMDAVEWFMFVGFVLILIILWSIILRHVREAI